ncbi:hypothetical protein J2Y69_001219 [Microbacterium resistens]|uniref:Transposase n=1 Tax=Microbacterium resistens TaxID=156977 RepID=A0ABU1SAI8_9MICO|nr:hypothetical protein [Microbacterium resistens]
MLIPILEQLRVTRDISLPCTHADVARVDKTYSSRTIRQHLRGRGIKAAIQ